jgi:hypothetical protein
VSWFCAVGATADPGRIFKKPPFSSTIIHHGLDISIPSDRSRRGFNAIACGWIGPGEMVSWCGLRPAWRWKCVRGGVGVR